MSVFNPQDRSNAGRRITMGLYRITQAIDSLMRKRGKQAKLSPAQIQAIVRHLQQAGLVQVYEMCWGCQLNIWRIWVAGVDLPPSSLT